LLALPDHECQQNRPAVVRFQAVPVGRCGKNR
jgi:hypothetical protein